MYFELSALLFFCYCVFFFPPLIFNLHPHTFCVCESFLHKSKLFFVYSVSDSESPPLLVHSHCIHVCPFSTPCPASGKKMLPTSLSHCTDTASGYGSELKHYLPPSACAEKNEGSTQQLNCSSQHHLKHRYWEQYCRKHLTNSIIVQHKNLEQIMSPM